MEVGQEYRKLFETGIDNLVEFFMEKINEEFSEKEVEDAKLFVKGLLIENLIEDSFEVLSFYLEKIRKKEL